MRKAIDYLVEQAKLKIDKNKSYSTELEALGEIYLYSMHVEVEQAIDELKYYERINDSWFKRLLWRMFK